MRPRLRRSPPGTRPRAASGRARGRSGRAPAELRRAAREEFARRAWRAAPRARERPRPGCAGRAPRGTPRARWRAARGRPRPRALGTGGRREGPQQAGHDEVDLDRLDAAAVVAHQAATGVELEQEAARPRVVRVEAEQRQRARRLALGAHAEDERRTEQVLERLAFVDHRVGDQLGADDRHRQLGAPHPLQRGQQRPPDRVSEQPPALVEAEDLQPVALGAHQVHREHRDQADDLLADALGLRVFGAPRPRLRAGQVADRQVGDLVGADAREPRVGVGEAQLGEAGARVDLQRAADLLVGPRPCWRAWTTSRQVGSRAARMTRSTAATTAVSHAAARSRAAGRTGTRPRRPGAGARARRAAGRAARAAPGRAAARSTRRAARPPRAGGSGGRPSGRSRRPARPAGRPRSASFWASVVLPDPSAPTLRTVALRSRSEPSRRLNATGWREPVSVWPRWNPRWTPRRVSPPASSRPPARS